MTAKKENSHQKGTKDEKPKGHPEGKFDKQKSKRENFKDEMSKSEQKKKGMERNPYKPIPPTNS